jgi:outer membrane protein assembly factor BamB
MYNNQLVGRTLAVGLATLMLSTVIHAQTSWPMYQVDTNHSGHIPISIDPASIQAKWDVDLGQYALNPITAADGKIFVSDTGYFDSNDLFVLDKETGDLLWSFEFDDPFSVNPPSYDSGKVYIQTCNHSGDTWLWCFDAETGVIVFKAPTSAQ